MASSIAAPSTPWAPSPAPHGDDLRGPTIAFSPIDYVLFGLMLVASAIIGVYFAFFAKQKQNTTQEYLMGGKTMGLFPVTMSLIASWVSGITLLGMPAEVYTYGTQFWSGLIGLIFSTIVTGVFFLPVIHKLQLTTSYEYLALRFSQKVRVLGSFLFIISHLLYIPIVIYLPALAFSQVTGVSLHLITPVVCLVCIFYTSLGGLKAVVWTDALQMVMMFGSMAVVVVAGTISVGGLQTVWERSEKSNRIEFFNLDIDPTVRHTFWNVTFGFSFMWATSLAANQGMVQRFLAMKTIQMCYRMLVMYWIGVAIIFSLSCYSGLLIYATYHDCDLISSKRVNAPDQVLPYYVMDVTGYLKGLPGLFMAGVTSAALSTMSTGLNAMSGVIFEDFIFPLMEVKPSEERASFLMKIICAILGVFCVAMVFIIEKMGAVIQLSASFSGITSGPLLALFSLGMFFPWTNTKGTLSGGIFGLIAMGWLVLSSQYRLSSGRVKLPVKPMSTLGCLVSENFTTHSEEYSSLQLSSAATFLEEEADEPWFVHRISYTLYSFLGFALTMIVGLAVSWFTRSAEKSQAVHPDLLTPLIRRYYGMDKPTEKTEESPESTPLNKTEDCVYAHEKTEVIIELEISKNGHFIHSTEMIKLAKEEER
ncbi:sodium-coupled monocarboxylate transporter 1-like [Hetaerina americana]|uniref:sodium-coupled monocarboxylate transporter 1-like n=1 Tax=Hetaerina americana TaxID=62018 RepID=UPI003A7F48F8